MQSLRDWRTVLESLGGQANYIPLKTAKNLCFPCDLLRSFAANPSLVAVPVPVAGGGTIASALKKFEYPTLQSHLNLCNGA